MRYLWWCGCHLTHKTHQTLFLTNLRVVSAPNVITHEFVVWHHAFSYWRNQCHYCVLVPQGYLYVRVYKMDIFGEVASVNRPGSSVSYQKIAIYDQLSSLPSSGFSFVAHPFMSMSGIL